MLFSKTWICLKKSSLTKIRNYKSKSKDALWVPEFLNEKPDERVSDSTAQVEGGVLDLPMDTSRPTICPPAKPEEVKINWGAIPTGGRMAFGRCAHQKH